ncbi:hypothetical protein [Nonomuraea sp. NPDC003214]
MTPDQRDTPEYEIAVDEPADVEGQEYPEEARASALDILREIMGGEPPADMLELARQRDAEFAARRAHAA